MSRFTVTVDDPISITDVAVSVCAQRKHRRESDHLQWYLDCISYNIFIKDALI